MHLPTWTSFTELERERVCVRQETDEDGTLTHGKGNYENGGHHVLKSFKICSCHKIFVICLKLHGLSPRVNYTDQETAACRRSDCQLLRIEGATWSA
jgi:hypothetical protein